MFCAVQMFRCSLFRCLGLLIWQALFRMKTLSAAQTAFCAMGTTYQSWGFSPGVMSPCAENCFLCAGYTYQMWGFSPSCFQSVQQVIFMLVTFHAWAHFLELSAQIVFSIYSDLIFVYVHNWWSWFFSPISIQSAQAHLPAVHSKFHSVLNSSTWAHSLELKKFCSVCTWSFVCKYIIYITLKSCFQDTGTLNGSKPFPFLEPFRLYCVAHVNLTDFQRHSVCLIFRVGLINTMLSYCSVCMIHVILWQGADHEEVATLRQLP